MQDELYTADQLRPQPGPPRRRGRALAVTFAAALLIGAAGTAWIGWHYGWLNVDVPWADAPAQPLAAPAGPAQAQAVLPADSTAKLAGLETRIAELDREAEAASGNAVRAEGLLIAFAARRAIERGRPLGYLENQLRLRFGAAQPQSVDRIIRAAANPVTLDQLTQQLTAIEPQLGQSAPSEGTIDWVQREIGELFIVRHQDSPSPAPEQRLTRARQYLAGGRVEPAMDEISRMPGAGAARGWLAAAQSYVTTERALEIIENAAVLQPQVSAPASPPPVPLVAPSGMPAAGPPAQPAPPPR